MPKIYIVRSMYLPNSAVSNRCFGHLKAFSQMGWDIEMVFVSPDSNRSKVNISIPSVQFRYLWEDSNISNKLLRYIEGCFLVKDFVDKLPKGANILLLEIQSMYRSFFKRNDINVYYETTEHPSIGTVHPLVGKGNLSRHFGYCKKLKHIFVISTALRICYIQNGISQDQITVVNMTVDPKRFEGLQKEENEKYIAYCGTVSNNKDGVDELIKAFAIAHKIHPDIKLYIIGATPSKNDKSRNLELIDHLGIRDYVVFTGLVKSEDMPQLLKNAAMLALDRPDSIQAQNGFPTKLGEYLLTGNPVVITRVGDIPLFLQDGVSALISQERTPEMFASKINWILEHPAEAKVIGERGRQVALKNFNCTTEGKKIIHKIEI